MRIEALFLLDRGEKQGRLPGRVEERRKVRWLLTTTFHFFLFLFDSLSPSKKSSFFFNHDAHSLRGLRTPPLFRPALRRSGQAQRPRDRSGPAGQVQGESERERRLVIDRPPSGRRRRDMLNSSPSLLSLAPRSRPFRAVFTRSLPPESRDEIFTSLRERVKL